MSSSSLASSLPVSLGVGDGNCCDGTVGMKESLGGFIAIDSCC